MVGFKSANFISKYKPFIIGYISFQVNVTPGHFVMGRGG
jgi:hypothetical protein